MACYSLSSPVNRIRTLLVALLAYIVFVQFWILPVRQHDDSSMSSTTRQRSEQRRRDSAQLTNHFTVDASNLTDATKSFATYDDHRKMIPMPKPWKRHSGRSIDNLPYPIFVTSLPKSGTTSIAKFFKCGHVRASHTWIQRGRSSTLAGRCIHENIRHQKPPLDHCGTYDVYTDTGVRTFVRAFVRSSLLPYAAVFRSSAQQASSRKFSSRPRTHTHTTVY